MIDYERAVLEFLFTEENLPIALEVSKLVEQLRKKVHVEFWLAFRDALERRLGQSRWGTDWDIWMTAKDQLLADWASCKLTPQRVSTDQLFIRPCLQQGGSRYDYYLHYGLVWNQPVRGVAVFPFKPLRCFLLGELVPIAQRQNLIALHGEYHILGF